MVDKVKQELLMGLSKALMRFESVRFIRMRKQIHDCNTAVNGSVVQ
jgi:hypothetical protein